MTRFAGAGMLAAAALLVMPMSVDAQMMASERAHLTQMVAGTEIEIDYSRPSARGRDELFGGLVDWGRTWTPGANDNTTIRFSEAVELNGNAVEAGTYGVWIQARENEPWIFMLHPDTTLFHTRHPDLSEGVLTFEVQPVESPYFIETLTLHFPRVAADRARLELHWGQTRVPIEIEVESGVQMTVPETAARPLEGEWLMISPRDRERGRDDQGMPLTLEWDPATERLEGTWRQGRDDVPILMVRRAEGVYQLGMMVGDEVGSIIDGWFFEFVFDSTGAATGFEVRDEGDDIRFMGERAGG